MSEGNPFGKNWEEDDPVREEKERLEGELDRIESEIETLKRARDDYQMIMSSISSDDVDVGYDVRGNQFQLILTYDLPEARR